MWGYAEDWSRYAVREGHPYEPHWCGLEIAEAQFRQVVRAMHGIASSEPPTASP